MRDHDGRPEPLRAPLTWDEAVTRHGHDCAVIWDRDMSGIEWEPRLVERHGGERVDRGDHYEVTVYGVELWADDLGCVDRMRRLGKQACRCHRWDRTTKLWVPRIDPARNGLDRFARHLHALETARSVDGAIKLVNQTEYAGVLQNGRRRGE